MRDIFLAIAGNSALFPFRSCKEAGHSLSVPSFFTAAVQSLDGGRKCGPSLWADTGRGDHDPGSCDLTEESPPCLRKPFEANALSSPLLAGLDITRKFSGETQPPIFDVRIAGGVPAL